MNWTIYIELIDSNSIKAMTS
ncbi:Protein of unknown function [Leuconostoc citreum LBAE E16]|nr:Protein of unknown function [Leuconostoc citreum LBAE E16]